MDFHTVILVWFRPLTCLVFLKRVVSCSVFVVCDFFAGVISVFSLAIRSYIVVYERVFPRCSKWRIVVDVGGFPLIWPCDNPCSAIPILCVSRWLLLIKGGSYVVVWIGLLWYYSPGRHPVKLQDAGREVLIGWRAPGSSDWLCGVAFIVPFGMCGNSLSVGDLSWGFVVLDVYDYPPTDEGSTC